jgi:hypothetical protein
MKPLQARLFRFVITNLLPVLRGPAAMVVVVIAALLVMSAVTPRRAAAQSRTSWQPVWQLPPGAQPSQPAPRYEDVSDRASQAAPRYQDPAPRSAEPAPRYEDEQQAPPVQATATADYPESRPVMRSNERTGRRYSSRVAAATDEEPAVQPRYRANRIRRASYDAPAGVAPETIPTPSAGPAPIVKPVPQAESVTTEPAPYSDQGDGSAYQGDGPVYQDDGGDGCGASPCDCGPCYGTYGGCGSCGPCGPRCWFGSRLEARGDYLLMWGKGDFVPALVTTSPNGTDRTAAGVLGEQSTSILFGNRDMNDTARSGGRVTLDWWLGGGNCVAIEGSYLGLGDHKNSFDASSQGDPILARPFFNVNTALQDSGLVAFPNVVTGNLHVADTTDFQSAEFLLRTTWFRQGSRHIDFLIGYRYVRLDDDLQIDEHETSTDPAGIVPVGTTLALSDRFHTLNEFNGLEAGVSANWRYCRWSTEALLKMAVGNSSSRVWIDGSTTIQEPTQTAVTSQGGFLAQPTNIGHYNHNDLAVVPELGLTLGYDLTCRLKFTVGYSFIYWSKVARPGDQISTNVNPTQFAPNTLTGLPSPQFRYTTTDYWAQGLTLGLDFRF